MVLLSDHTVSAYRVVNALIALSDYHGNGVVGSDNMQLCSYKYEPENYHPIQTFCIGSNFLVQNIKSKNCTCLKEYYEIVGESRPLSAFFPKHADLFTEMHF